MMTALTYIGYAYALMLFTWVFYLALMHLQNHRDLLKGPSLFFAKQVLLIGFVLDVALNLIVGTVVLLEPPRELLLTNRLIRLKHKKNFRGKIARWVCHSLLNFLDPSGTHC